jgi:hypothetical protein
MKKTSIMRYLITILFFSILISCDDGKKIYITDSSGIINMVNVVSENSVWESKVGETVRAEMASDAEGLPQKEPLYKLKHIPTKAFTGFAKKNRTFIKFTLGDKNDFVIANDTFARPQVGFFIEGKSEEDLIKLFNENKTKIVSELNKTEILEKWRRMNKSLGDSKPIEDKFGVNLKFPTAYRYANATTDDFIWLRKDIKKGSMEIFVYRVPINKIENDSSTISNIVKVRDSIGKTHIPGPREGSYMITEEAYMPYLYKTEVDGRFAYETRGTWVVKNAFMGGPFLNYVVKDEKNDQYIVVEGIVFKPTAEKRNNIFEIEAIARSLKFLE